MAKDCNFEKLVETISTLRGPNGCPWDKEQTHKSIMSHLIEEAYEVLDAIECGDFNHLKEELGDLLLQIVFHAQMASEDDKFDINDVVNDIVEKLKRRHPHIFSDKILSTPKEVLKNWERIKREEKRVSSHLAGIPSNLPALIYAAKLQAKASRVGFDWQRIRDVVKKLDEEVEEFKDNYFKGENVEEEIGDILFTVVNIARHLNVDSEIALRRVVNKFCKRFELMENMVEERGLDFEVLSLEEKDELWEEVKKLICPK
ncbi:MAG TPA: nucleoside triphosphate pyrophosphohydrolase [Actinobacteria bacterium]|nr:nucleoside triphosphate pyrophosphohydrolase [Actinomycetota bacterium]